MLLNIHCFIEEVAFSFTQSWLGKNEVGRQHGQVLQPLKAAHRGSHMSFWNGTQGQREVCVSVCCMYVYVLYVCNRDSSF